MKTGAILANAQQLQQNQQNHPNNQGFVAKFEKQFVSGGCDGKVRIWKFDESAGNFIWQGNTI